MSPSAGMMLVQQIQPLILAAVGRGAVPLVGTEDTEELAQDTLAIAAAMLDSAEAAERPYTASTVAFYALQAAKGGRRSTYTGRSDVLCPAAGLDGSVQALSLDKPVAIGADVEDEAATLHDVLPVRREGPDQEAGRRIDWEEVCLVLNDRQSVVLRDAACGIGPSRTAEDLAVSRPRLTQLRRQIAKRVSDTWGATDPFADVTAVPGWQRHLSVAREQWACRAERARQRRQRTKARAATSLHQTARE